MLLKTNNLISRQVVKFPQKQMGASLIRIGIKRFYDRTNMSDNENEKYRWFWDSDGYHAMSNYYYVGAIFDFYEYYDIYEKQYIERYTEIRKTLEKDLAFSDSIREYYQKKDDEISELKAVHERELKEKEKEIARANEKAGMNELGGRLVSEIKKVIEDSTFADPDFLKRIILGIREQLAQELVMRYNRIPNADKSVLEQLTKPLEPKDGTLFSLLQALAADIILPSAIDAKKSKASGKIKEIGKDDLEGDGLPVADFALKGGRQLIDGSMDKLFWEMCSQLSWDNLKNK
jgi:predicted CopG family antitoxin